MPKLNPKSTQFDINSLPSFIDELQGQWLAKATSYKLVVSIY